MVSEDAERLAQRLRLFNVESERLSALEWLVACSRRRLSEQAAHALLYRLGPQSFTDRVLLAWARADTGRDRRSLARACEPAAALDSAGSFRSNPPTSSAAA